MGDVKDAVTGASEKVFSVGEVFDAVTGRRVAFIQNGGLYSAVTGRRVAIVTGIEGGNSDPDAVITIPGVVNAAGLFQALDLSGDTVVKGAVENFDAALYLTGMAEPNYNADSAKTTALPEHVREGKTFESMNRIYTGTMKMCDVTINGHTVHITAGYVPQDVDIVVPCSGSPGTDPDDPEVEPDPDDPPPIEYIYTLSGAGDILVNGDYYFDHQEEVATYYTNGKGIYLVEIYGAWEIQTADDPLWIDGRPAVAGDPTTITSWLQRDGTAPWPTITRYGEEPEQPGSGADFVISGAGDSTYNGDYTDTGNTANGNPVYSNGTRYLGAATDDDGYKFWCLKASTDFSGGGPRPDNGEMYYQNTGQLAASPASSDAAWVVGKGTSPAPTVTAGGGGYGGSSIDPDKVTQFDITETSNSSGSFSSKTYKVSDASSTGTARQWVSNYSWMLRYNGGVWELANTNMSGRYYYTSDANPFTSTNWCDLTGADFTVKFDNIVTS